MIKKKCMCESLKCIIYPIKSTILPWRYLCAQQNCQKPFFFFITIVLCVRRTRTRSPRLCIGPAGSWPRVWNAWWLPGSRLLSRLPAEWWTFQCLLWRIIQVKLHCADKGHFLCLFKTSAIRPNVWTHANITHVTAGFSIRCDSIDVRVSDNMEAAAREWKNKSMVIVNEHPAFI